MIEISQESGRIARESNFELLRIVAMVMIIACHYAGHGIEQVLWSSSPIYNKWLEGSFFHKFYTLFLSSQGQIGVALFFMMTGYYMIKSRVMPFKLVKLMLEIFYYSFFALVLFWVTYLLKLYEYPKYASPAKMYLFIHTLIPVSSGSWWFVTAYVALYLIVPLLDYFMLRLNKKGFILYIFIALIFWYILPVVFNYRFNTIQKATFFYSLGAYIRLYYKKNNNKVFLLFFIFLLTVCYTLTEYVQLSFVGKNKVSKMFNLICDGFITGVFVPLTAVFVFLLFKNLSFAYNKFINMIASTTFGIYLISDSDVGRPLIWNGIIHTFNHYSSALYPLYAVLSIFTVFVFCSLIDLIRIKFIEPPVLCFFKLKYEQIKKTFVK